MKQITFKIWKGGRWNRLTLTYIEEKKPSDFYISKFQREERLTSKWDKDKTSIIAETSCHTLWSHKFPTVIDDRDRVQIPER